MARFRRQAGYTLVEMLVAMIIMGVVLGGLTALFVSASHAELDVNLRWQAQQSARLALDKMRREIHCASSATSSASSAVTLALPAGCGGATAATVTWCAQGSGSRYGLYRVASATCSGGTKYVDYLKSSSLFTITTASGSLAKVSVDIPVLVNPLRPMDTYDLKDDIVLRNSVRS